MKEVVCPPCGTVLREQNEERLIEVVRAHAKEHHGHVPSREEVLGTVRDADASRGTGQG